MTPQEFKLLIFIGSLIILFITYLCGKRYNKTLERMSGTRRSDRASAHEDMHLVLTILILGIIGTAGIVFSILVYFNILTLHQ
jgi:hypothetical protein